VETHRNTIRRNETVRLLSAKVIELPLDKNETPAFTKHGFEKRS